MMVTQIHRMCVLPASTPHGMHNDSRPTNKLISAESTGVGLRTPGRLGWVRDSLG